MTTPFPFVSGAVLTAAQLNAITTLPISAKTASYTLAVGDVGSRVQMTNAGATTITVNTGIFPLVTVCSSTTQAQALAQLLQAQQQSRHQDL